MCRFLSFHKRRLRPRAAERLEPYCTAGEQVEVRGQAIWIDHAGGVARSKLTPAVLDRVFGSTVTMRNIKTLRAVAAMAARARPASRPSGR